MEPAKRISKQENLSSSFFSELSLLCVGWKLTFASKAEHYLPLFSTFPIRRRGSWEIFQSIFSLREDIGKDGCKQKKKLQVVQIRRGVVKLYFSFLTTTGKLTSARHGCDLDLNCDEKCSAKTKEKNKKIHLTQRNLKVGKNILLNIYSKQHNKKDQQVCEVWLSSNKHSLHKVKGGKVEMKLSTAGEVVGHLLSNQPQKTEVKPERISLSKGFCWVTFRLAVLKHKRLINNSNFSSSTHLHFGGYILLCVSFGKNKSE